MFKLVVIDDVQDARDIIHSIVKRYCKNIDVVGVADGVRSGIELIKTHKPHIVLLDIEMYDGTGFDLLNKLKPIDFKVIFITAYEEYALKAFKFSALDYILKPINADELIAAIERTEDALKQGNMQNLEIFEANYLNTDKESKKIILKTIDCIYAVSIKDIVRCEAEESYTTFFLNDGEKIVMSKPLKEYDELLNAYGFFRTHQSHLINLEFFEKYKKTDGGFAVLKDNSSVPVSSRKKDMFLQAIERL